MSEFEQMSLTEATFNHFAVNSKIRLIELFGGIGAQSKALEVLGADFESWRVCEWSAQSIVAYNAIHKKDWADYSVGLSKDEVIAKVKGVSQDYNSPLTDEQLAKKPEDWLRKLYSSMVAIKDYCPDISRLKGQDLNICDREKYAYIMTYSFPCQDLSVAGLRKGMQKDSSTRSGLLWEVERILNELHESGNLPQVLIMENVPQVCNGENLKPWNDWLDALERLGYSNYHKILNAKNYGIPQSRKRCFMVSVLGDYAFTFPDPVRLKFCIKDFLEKGKVDEKYYLSDEIVKGFIAHNEKEEGTADD